MSNSKIHRRPDDTSDASSPSCVSGTTDVPDQVRRVLSGIQPSGKLHLGNYLGALRRFVSLQEYAECYYCIVDLHSITVYQEPKRLRAAVRETAAGFLACGLDPIKHVIFHQSAVTAHAELAWILGCVARMGWLGRMTQFKDKAGNDRENASVGLFTYPILMAADILVYRPSHVPVGDDQKQHIELCRDIAQKFNTDYAEEIAEAGLDPECLVVPQPIIGGPASRVMSLRDGKRKMSKSEPSDMALINLCDSPDEIAAKIRKAKTDPFNLPEDESDLKDRPEARNLISIMAAMLDQPVSKVLATYAGGNFAMLKSDLTELLITKLVPIGDQIRLYLNDSHQLDEMLHSGAQQARAQADDVMSDVRRVVGLLTPGSS